MGKLTDSNHNGMVSKREYTQRFLSNWSATKASRWFNRHVHSNPVLMRCLRDLGYHENMRLLTPEMVHLIQWRDYLREELECEDFHSDTTLLLLKISRLVEELDQRCARIEQAIASYEPSDDYLDIVELSKLLKMNHLSIYNWVSKGKIPFTKINGHLLFKRSAIDDFMQQHAGGTKYDS